MTMRRAGTTGGVGRRDAAARLGITQWFHLGDAGRVEAAIAGLERLGIRHLRTNVSWADYHADGGEEWYRWLLPTLGRRFELLPCVTCTPPSLGRFPSCAAPPRDPKAYADFLDVLVSSHGQWFDTVELWNEPNNVLDWDWRADPQWSIFSEMVGGAAYWLRHLGKTVVLGGMCPTDANWLRLMASRGVLEHIDVVALHGFPGTWSEPFAGWPAEIATIRDVLESRRISPAIWITECGYSTWRHDEMEQARALLEALAAPVPRIYWYSYADLDPARPTQSGFHVDERHYHTGLVTHDGRDKLVARLLADGGIAKLEDTVRAVSRRPRRTRSAAGPVLITGGCGFIGGNIADRLAERGENVLVLDNLSRPGSEENARWLADRHPMRIAFAMLDVRDRLALEPLVRSARAILHLAAQVAVTTSLDDPLDDFGVNAVGTLNLLDAARRSGSDVPFLFASTNKVYGALEWARFERTPRGWWPSTDGTGHGFAELGVDEHVPIDLSSPYGCSKGAADAYVRDFAHTFGLPAVSLRMSCVYGPRQFGTEDQGWIAHFMRRAAAGKPITIYGDGHQVRDALFVDDAVDAWISALDHIDRTRGKAFNLGGGTANALSLAGLVDRIAARGGPRPDIAYADPRPGDQLWYVSDTRALRSATGWRPRVPLDLGLSRLSRWLDERFSEPQHQPVSGVAS